MEEGFEFEPDFEEEEPEEPEEPQEVPEEEPEEELEKEEAKSGNLQLPLDEDDRKKVLTRFMQAKLAGERAKQISERSPIRTDINLENLTYEERKFLGKDFPRQGTLTDAQDIAMLEIYRKEIPIGIKEEYDDGTYKIWYIEDFKYIA